ncbi:uncharacterized protein LOC134183599 [Corticium candelabrum]|uniref:uncharacterized protein LOC134183599 n=1 Tax=Corticium candelabrum TaxID=121492 RepID=UPI002E272420|nr:uncharacterized protein LOC134183599 [Corticium candelabrum]
MTEVRRRWGDEETASEKVKRKRLEWLGHLARMPDHRIPNSTLFEVEWYDEAVRSRAGWSTLCRDGLERWRERMGHKSDKARHKCMEERRKPIREQQGAIQCSNCLKWFRSKGGLTVHRCVEF